ncbi:MAG: hypothetical protein QOE34_2372 [Verrucomicrobiota bacterium]|jgi:hypothetical protein
MKCFPVVLCALAISISAAQAGPDSYSSKETASVPPCPSWYADNEWNVSLWGAYAFTDDDYPTFQNSILGFGRSIGPVSGPKYDRYLETDHAWGGGIDAKYFFRRYFGLGIEGFAVAAQRSSATVTILRPPFGFIGSGVEIDTRQDERAIGALLGTFTFRYPIGCSRWAPYVWAGGGAIFGGGEVEKIAINDPLAGAFLTGFKRGSQTKAIGQLGGGIEVRLTPHIGLINDFSWNVIEGRDNNFGMVRTGINFAF